MVVIAAGVTFWIEITHSFFSLKSENEKRVTRFCCGMKISPDSRILGSEHNDTPPKPLTWTKHGMKVGAVGRQNQTVTTKLRVLNDNSDVEQFLYWGWHVKNDNVKKKLINDVNDHLRLYLYQWLLQIESAPYLCKGAENVRRLCWRKSDPRGTKGRS